MILNVGKLRSARKKSAGGPPAPDADLTAYLAAIASTGFPAGATEHTAAANLFSGLKSAGLYSGQDRIWILSPSGTSDAALLCIKSLTNLSMGDTGFGNPSFDPLVGFGFDGSNFLFNNAQPMNASVNYQINSANLWCIVANNIGTKAAFMGATSDAALDSTQKGCGISQDSSPNPIGTNFDNSCAVEFLSGSPSNGLFMASSVSNIDHALYRNGVLVGSNNNGTFATDITEQNMCIGICNVAGSADQFMPYTFVGGGYGRGLSQSEATSFFNLISAYNTAIGRTI